MNIIDDSATKEASATRNAYFAIRDMVLRGELQPGQKLKIDSLRAFLGTGASPIREALSLLTSDMLVERFDQRGFRVAPASAANFEEILTLRCSLEEMALRTSLQQATPAWEETLVLANHRMKRAASTGRAAFEEQHKAFHMALLANCGSPILLKYCSQLYDLNIRYRNIAGNSQSYQSRNIPAEHDAILEAAVQRDVARTSERLLSHYRLTGAYLNGVFSAMF